MSYRKSLNSADLSYVIEESNNLMKQQKDVKCGCGLRGTFVCLDKQCESSSYICSKNSKQCLDKYHKKCRIASFKKSMGSVQKKLLDKKKFLFNYSRIMDSYVQGFVSQIDQIKENFRDYLQTQFGLYILTDTQKNALTVFDQNCLIKTKNLQISELEKQQIYIQTQQLFNFNVEKVQRQVLKMKSQKGIQMKLFPLQKYMKKFQKNNNFDYKLGSLPMKQRIFSNSSIIQNVEQSEIILNFFEKKVKKGKLLYKASQNDFQIDNFKKNCTGIPNTLVLIQTQFGKTIGGFTQLCWRNTTARQFQNDSTNSSFMFSVTNNQKLKQKSLQKSGITQVPGHGPTFSDNKSKPDIFIVNSANTMFSAICFNNGYANQAYNYWNQQSSKSFSGYVNINVRLKDWEVWSITFDE